MRILFDITHPAHVHLFRNAITELDDQGHEIRVTSRRKEVTTRLLDAYSINHTVLSDTNSMSLATEWTGRTVRLLNVTKSFRPDVIVSRFNPAAAFVSMVMQCPYLMFDDTGKDETPITQFTYKFADVIFTPTSFAADLGSDHVRYEGLHELAYLHPNWFDPDLEVLKENGVDPDETYSILRFVSWNAHHDSGEQGFSKKTKRELVSLLSEYGNVYITSENNLPPEFSPYQLPVSPEHIHHLLYYANLFIGDSQTMTCEAGILGTPAIRSNSLVQSTHAAYLTELEELYNLVYSTTNEEYALKLAKDVISGRHKNNWNEKKDILLKNKIDTTEFAIQQIKNINEI